MKELVIAAYNRNYSWINQLNSDIKISIYNKNPNTLKDGEIFIEPNKGRDVHTFFYHLHEKYDNLSDITFFSQDYHLDHVNNYIEIINGDEEVWDRNAKQSTKNSCWFFCTSYPVIECERNGIPHHPGLNVERMWNTIFPNVECPIRFQFTPTGHFAITKEHARRQPKEFYAHILNILEDEINFPTAPWELERLEPYIFL